jgi:hypothetical protein
VLGSYNEKALFRLSRAILLKLRPQGDFRPVSSRLLPACDKFDAISPTKSVLIKKKATCSKLGGNTICYVAEAVSYF